MNYSEIVSNLEKNNVKSTGFYTTEQLLDIFNKASVEVPNTRPEAITLTYSGPLDTGFTWQIAEPIGSQSAGEIRTIGKTDVSKLLQNSEFKLALLKANSYNDVIVNKILDGEYATDQSGNKVRIKPGWTDIMSERFVLEAKGPIISLTPNADPTRVWGMTELDAALRSEAPTINGIAKEDLIRARNTLGQTTGSESQAKAIILDYVNELSVEHTSLLTTYVDSNGKIIANPLTQHAQHLETKQFFERIGIQAPGTELPAAPNKTSLLNADSRSLVKPDQFRNAQLANELIQQHTAERIAQAKAAGDASALAKASRYLDRLGMIGDIISLSLLASEANAAYAKGDRAGAQKIVEDGLMDYTGGLLGGLLAAKLTGSVAAPLVFFGPGGALLAGALTLAAGIFGGLVGSAGLGQLFSTFRDRTADKAADGSIRRDPLALDLDGDGIETIGLRDGKPILFDHDGDGIKTGTGWLKSDDAWLVLDRNRNGTIDSGRELFGVETLKSNTKLATDGFDALRDMDSNTDEKIDQSDVVFDQLRLWRDSNQDGISQIDELSTLNTNGITSIGLQSTVSTKNLGNGNIQRAFGVFNRSDGITGTTGLHNGTAVNLDLVINSFYRQFTDQIVLTDQASKLPALIGSGQVRDLPEAISLSPELGSFVESYLRVSTRQAQMDMLDDFLEKWAETSNMKSLKAQAEVLAGNGVKLVYSLAGLSPGTSDYDDFVRKLGIVERFMGFTYGGPTGAVRFTPLLANSGVTTVSLTRRQVESISMAYDMFKNDLYQSLLFQSRLQVYASNISFSFSNDKILLDAAAIESNFKKIINANPPQGIIDLIEFIGVAGASRLTNLNWNAFDFLLAELNNASELGAFSGDLDDLYVRFAGPTENILYGSSRSDLLVGTLGFDTLFGGASNDILHGKSGNDFLNGEDGDDTLLGASGNDTLDGASGNDIIDGGDGNDLITDNSGNNTLRGGAGNDTIRSRGTFAGGSGDDLLQSTDVWFGDTYLFQIGDGKDVINDLGYGGTDAISFGAGINPSELPLHRVGQDLHFQVNANDHLSVKDWFSSSHQYIERIRFANSTTWNVGTILSTPIISAGSANADNLIGWQGIDSLEGGGGNDTLDGAAGNDIIDGGDGNDLITDNSGNNTLRGGAGNDTIRSRGTFAGGSGDDLLQSTDVWFGDTYLFQIGDGKDVINDLGYGGTDFIIFGSGINANMIWFRKSGTDLEVTRIGSTEGISITNWYASSFQQIERFRSADGKVLSKTNVDALVNAMAAFSPPSIGQTTLSDNYLGVLNPVIAANWL
jgi:Ca2+-binding RTX toxin-like protein